MPLSKQVQEGTIGDRLLDMFEQSVIIQSVVTLVLVIACCIIWVKGALVPDGLLGLTMAVVGFWFGQKTNNNSAATAQKIATNIAGAVVEAGVQSVKSGTGDGRTTGIDC